MKGGVGCCFLMELDLLKKSSHVEMVRSNFEGFSKTQTDTGFHGKGCGEEIWF